MVSFYSLLGVLHRVARAHEADVGDCKQVDGGRGAAPAAEAAEEEQQESHPSMFASCKFPGSETNLSHN